MARSSSLKKQISGHIYSALALHFVVFMWAIGLIDSFELKRTVLPGLTAVGILGLVGLLLRGLFPPRWRERLVHWKYSNPLPGSRAFTILAPSEPRISLPKLRKRYGPLPEKEADQNKKFYEIYKKHHNEPAVIDAHKSYLAARDLAIINLLLAALLPIAMYFFSGDQVGSLVYFGSLAAIYALTCIAAQTYGARFVENTLACACK